MRYILVLGNGQAGPCMGRCMGRCMGGVGLCILPGFVRLDLGVVGGLDDDGEEVVGVVSFNPT